MSNSRNGIVVLISYTKSSFSRRYHPLIMRSTYNLQIFSKSISAHKVHIRCLSTVKFFMNSNACTPYARAYCENKFTIFKRHFPPRAELSAFKALHRFPRCSQDKYPFREVVSKVTVHQQTNYLHHSCVLSRRCSS